MYQIFIDTSLDDLLIILLKNHQVIGFIHQPKLLKKSEILPIEFNKLISKYKVKLAMIDSFYITLGPGSFMGSRVSLIFVRTICQVTKAKLYTINTLLFISQGIDGQYYIDAKSNQSYTGIVKNNHITQNLTNYIQDTKLDYSMIIDNFPKMISLFELQTNILKIEPNYLKDPKVGG